MDTLYKPRVRKPVRPLEREVGSPEGRYEPDRSIGPTMKERLARNWFWISIVSFSITLSVCAYRLYAPQRYISTAMLLVDATELSPTHDVELPDVSPGLMRVYHMATSTDMLDHLIDTFALMGHYGIPQNDPLGRARAQQHLLTLVEPHYLDEQCMSVSVIDSDRNLAAAMANEIQKQLLLRARRSAELALERSVSVYTRVLERTEERVQRRRADMAELVARELYKLNEGRAHAEDGARLQRVIDMLAAADLPVSELNRSRDFASEMLAEPDLPGITLVRAATPDTSPSRSRSTLLLALITFPLVLVLMMTGVVVWHFHGHGLRAWLSSPSPR